MATQTKRPSRKPPVQPLNRVADVTNDGNGNGNGNGRIQLHSSSIVGADRIERYRRSRFNPIFNLTPQRLTNYLMEWAAGYLRYLGITMDQVINRDATFKTVAPKRCADAAREKWSIQIIEGHEKDPVAKEQKEKLEYFYQNLRAVSAVDANQMGGVGLLSRQMVRSGVGMKYSCHEIMWRQNMAGLTAVLSHVPVWFFESRTGRLRFLMEDFSWDGVPMQTPDIVTSPLEAASWMVAVGEGLMEAGVVLYLYSRMSLQDWVSYSEERGKQPLVGHTNAVFGSSRWDALDQAIQSIGGGSRLLLGPPDQEKIDTINTATAGTLPMETLYEMLRKEKSALWRGADLSTVSSGKDTEGSGASLQGGETETLKEDDTQWISENCQVQLDPQIIRITMGPDVPVLAYFSLGGARKTNLLADLNIITGLVNIGLPVGVSTTYEQFDIPVPQPGEAMLQNAQPAMGAGGFGGGGEPRTEAANPGKLEGGPTEDLQEELPPELANMVATMANGGAEAKKFLARAAGKLGDAQVKALRPVAQAMMEAYNEETEEGFKSKLMALRRALPQFLLKINRDPATAEAFEKAIGTALVMGMTANEELVNAQDTPEGDSEGHWITFRGGRHVFIKHGETMEDAIKNVESGKHHTPVVVSTLATLKRMGGDEKDTLMEQRGFAPIPLKDRKGMAGGEFNQETGKFTSFHWFKDRQGNVIKKTPDEIHSILRSNPRSKVNEGTTEGALKAWETKRAGGQFAHVQSADAHMATRKAWADDTFESHKAAAEAHEAAMRAREEAGDKEGASTHRGLADIHRTAASKAAIARFRLPTKANEIVSTYTPAEGEKDPALMTFQEFQASKFSDPALLGISPGDTGQLGSAHKAYISAAVTARRPVLKATTDYYGARQFLPLGYVADGLLYVWKPEEMKPAPGVIANALADDQQALPQGQAQPETPATSDGTGNAASRLSPATLSHPPSAEGDFGAVPQGAAPAIAPELLTFEQFKAAGFLNPAMLGVEANDKWQGQSAHRAAIEDALLRRKPVNRQAVDGYKRLGVLLPAGYRISDDGKSYVFDPKQNVGDRHLPRVWAQEELSELQSGQRYAVVLPHSTYSLQARKLVGGLVSKGYPMVDVRNQWLGNVMAAHALRVKFRTEEGGRPAEVVIHTPDSYEAATRSEAWLKELGKSTNARERKRYANRIEKLWGNVQVPEGVKEIQFGREQANEGVANEGLTEGIKFERDDSGRIKTAKSAGRKLVFKRDPETHAIVEAQIVSD